VNHRSNRVGLEQLRYIARRSEITLYDISPFVVIQINRQNFAIVIPQDATQFPSNMSARPCNEDGP